MCWFFFFPSSNPSGSVGITKSKIHAVSGKTALLQFQRQSHKLKIIGGDMTLGSVMLLIILKTNFSP